MAFGVNEGGFQIKSFDEIRTELEASYRSIFGDEIRVKSTSLLGQQIGIFTKELYDAWQASLNTYQARYPALSFGRALEQIVSLAGLERKGDFKTSGFVYLVGDVGTTIPQGSLLSTQIGHTVQTSSPIVLVDGIAPIIKISKEPGNLAASFILRVVKAFGSFFADEAGNSQTISFTATSSAITDQINTLLNEVDAVSSVGVTSSDITITFRNPQFLPFLSITDGVLSVETAGLPNGGAVGSVAIEPGPIVIDAFDIIEINAPINGLDSVVNTEAFVTGRAAETDLEVRTRWTERISDPQVSSAGAIRNAVKNLSGVSQALIFQDPGEIEVVVSGGEDNEIAKTIQLYKPAGILTLGSKSIVVNDENGNPKPIYFSRPSIRGIYVKVEITRGSGFSTDGESQVRGALIAFINSFQIGGVVRPSPDMIWALSDIVGIDDLSITLSENGNDGSFNSNSITLLNREKIAFERIDVILS